MWDFEPSLFRQLRVVGRVQPSGRAYGDGLNVWVFRIEKGRPVRPGDSLMGREGKIQTRMLVWEERVMSVLFRGSRLRYFTTVRSSINLPSRTTCRAMLLFSPVGA